MKYACLKREVYQDGDFLLTTIRQEDIMFIRKWRNEQIEILRQKNLLTAEDQKRYWNKVILPSISSDAPDIILFSYLFMDNLIGYGGLTHIDWSAKRAEVSFLLKTEITKDYGQHQIYFDIFLKLLKNITFFDLKLHRLYTEAYDLRPYHISVLENNGFKFEGRLRQHIYLEKEGRYIDSLIHGCLENDKGSEVVFEKKRGGIEEQNKSCINILVTSVSSKVPLLKALRSASLKLGNKGKIFGADIDAACIARYFCDDFWQMPRLSELEIEELVAYCNENNISCIIPTRDGELRYFAEHRDKLLREGIRVMISGKEGVEMCLDKLKFAGHLQAKGYPVIKTELDIEKLAAGTYYVVKERYGAGSHSLGLRLTKQEAVRHAAGLKEPIFQPFIAGREVSVDLFVDQQGRAKGSVVRARKLVVNGESQVSVTERNEKLEQLCANISEMLGLYGHIIWQVIIDQAEAFHIVECNCRFGGASTLSLAVGLDSFYWFLLEVAGANLAAYPMLPPAAGITQVRYAEDMIIP